MVLPTISRGFGIRDDYTDANLSTTNSGSVTTDTFTSNGDIVTWNVTFTNPSNGDLAILYRPVSGSDPSVFKTSTVRCNAIIWADSVNFQLRPWYHYTPSGTTDTGQNSLTNTTNLNQYIATNFPLTNGQGLVGNTTDQIGFEIINIAPVGAGTYSFTVLLDFTYQYKELLTLPSLRQPITLRKKRNMVEIPILSREGGVQQDLGSMSADVTVGGHLITTTAGQGQSTNTYTADQWWYILNGLTLETGTIQSDGNPTWQWFQSDQIQGKFLVTDYIPQEPMGRVQFWDYAIQLKKYDILGETSVNDLGQGPGGIQY